MKKSKLLLLPLVALLITSCSSSNSAKGTFISNEATNYITQECPISDIEIDVARADLVPAILPCLGHDTFVNLAGIKTDKPMILSFWASWCTVCAEDASSFKAAYAKLNKEIGFFGIAFMDNEAESLKSSFTWKLPFASVQDRAGNLRSIYGINGLPITLLLDKDGKIIHKISGPVGNPTEFIKLVNDKLISY